MSGRGGRRPLTKELLQRRYLRDRASIRTIAAETGWSYGKVHRELEDFGIPLRTRGGDMSGRGAGR